MPNIVLYEPEIPPNTGNIARLCVATNTKLFLKEPLGFSIDNKHLKRAGLDYWQHADVTLISSLDDLPALPSSTRYYFSTKAERSYADVTYQSNDFLIFGPETRGLPEEFIYDNPHALTIPMFNEHIRSINLSTAVGIVLYEAIRQLS